VTPERLWPKICVFLNEVSAVARSAEERRMSSAPN